MEYFIAFGLYNVTDLQGYIPIMYSDLAYVQEYNFLYQLH